MSKNPSEFVPTGVVGLDDLMKGIEAPGEAQPTPAPTPAPDPTPDPKVGVVDILPPDPKEGGEDPSKFTPSTQEPEPARPERKQNNAMREQLEKLAQEKASYEEEVKRLKAEQETGTTAHQQAMEELKALKEEHERLSVRNSMGDPMSHPEIRKLTEPWNAKLETLNLHLEEAGVNSGGMTQFVGNLVKKYIEAGDPGTDDFRSNMEHIRDQVDEFTGDIRRDSDRNFAQQEIMGMVREGATIGRQVRETYQEIQGNAPAFHYNQQMAVYSAEEREYEQQERTFFNPSEDIKVGDPLHHSVILRAMIDGSDEVKNAAETAKKFARMVLLPPKPISVQDLESVEPEKRQTLIQAHNNRHNEAIKRGRGVFAEALVARAVLPALWKELEALKSRVAGERDTPRPSNGDDSHSWSGESDASIMEFNPVSPDLNKIPR